MLKNYITIAVRHLVGHKLFSIITVCCLAIGITFALIIGLYVRNQESVNGSIRNVGNQYMIKSRWKVKGLGMDITTIPPFGQDNEGRIPRTGG
jgi:putative ABC transport system permease protein